MIDYKGYQIEFDSRNLHNYMYYHILKNGEYIQKYLPSVRSAKIKITKLTKKEQ